MLRVVYLVVLTQFVSAATVCAAEPGAAAGQRPHRPLAKMHGVGLADVRWTEGFWAERWELCRREMLPSVERALLDEANSEQLINLKIAAGLTPGAFRGTDWSDGDCYKWLEALALMFATTRDPELDRKLDEWIGIIARAQAPDGYLSTNMTLRQRPRYVPPPRGYGGTFHEMYNMGHLLTAACTHYQATGKDNFLRLRARQAITCTGCFSRGGRDGRDQRQPAGHHGTGRLVPHDRGPTLFGDGPSDHRCPRDDAGRLGLDARPCAAAPGNRSGGTRGVCHLLVLRRDGRLRGDRRAGVGGALQRIWTSAALRRTYITGGACAIPGGKSARGDDVHEAFGADYQLPNRTAYNETCANVGNAMWNWRWLELTGDAKHAEVMETVLYNSLPSAVSADGRQFCYANPLTWTGEAGGPTKHHTGTRWSVHSCYCCPPQVARTIAGLSRWAYSVSDDAVWVHLYGGNRLQTRLAGDRAVSLVQETRYPWDGHIQLTWSAAPAGETTLNLRIPTWAAGATLRVNGQSVPEPCSREPTRPCDGAGRRATAWNSTCRWPCG